MSGRGVAALLLATGALVGCGQKPEPDLSKLAVTGTVDVSPAPGAPDARVAATTPGLRPWTLPVTVTRK